MSCERSPFEREGNLRYLASEAERTGLLLGMAERADQRPRLRPEWEAIQRRPAFAEQIERCHEGPLEQRIGSIHGCQRSTTRATASPPPMQSVASPRLALRSAIA